MHLCAKLVKKWENQYFLFRHAYDLSKIATKKALGVTLCSVNTVENGPFRDVIFNDLEKD